jgi:hypothetical protein
MSRKAFGALIVGHRDVVSKWPHKALAAGVLIPASAVLSEDLDADCRLDPMSFGIGRGGLALQVSVIVGATLWQPQAPDEWALCIDTKKRLSEEQVIEARRLVLELVHAFDGDQVTPLIVVEKERSNFTLQPLTQDNVNDDL